MSDTAYDWRQIGREIAALRKPRLSKNPQLSRKANVAVVEVNYDRSAAKLVPPAIVEANYPKMLVRLFAIGVAIGVIGIAILLITIISNNENLKLMAAIFMAIGSITVVLALLRGQDLDEQNV